MESKLRYYFGSMVFLSGLILSIAGIGFGIFVNLMWTSDPLEIITTYSLLGIGLCFILLGINLMIRQRRPYGFYSNWIMVLGFVLSISGVIYFITIFENNWIYPYVTYLSFLYASGICLLSGNAFGNAVLKVIEENSTNFGEKASSKQYNVEDIEKEVEKTLSQAYSNNSNFSAFNLDVKDDKSDFRLSKTFTESQQEKIEIQDSILEAKGLQNTLTGKVNTNDYALDITSKMLSETMKKNSENQNKKFINKFKNKFNSKRK
ncbi:hypothetical protein Mzhil_0621 [Methanosalsum zhilinae DSM 4017]|uniref:Uncharacterized protein n=1 Tax=Methanosalsum zhilinae (strain DSM 4017 / NBRC 107636 / OCM 62 / WeN5) TaxID=679901 RepID=F7XQI6_METZD|nr:hypothetical protein Mzhil_0621 [Methanosalsum zhilinae DSM 4017]